MVSDTPNDTNLPLLLPERHPQHDLFVCDVADAVLKGDMASMEHPFYSLSKKPRTTVRRYDYKDKWIEIVPSVKGLPTIYDKDILIYVISQLMAKQKQGQKLSRRVRIVARDLLIFTNRNTGGKDYEALYDSLDRLDGTRIRTNVRTGGEENRKGFGLIENFEITHSEKTGRITDMQVTISEWLYNAISAHEVLTLHRDYFRLRKPLERRVYELARKHCGQQTQWSVKLETLRRKSGSTSPAKTFRFLITQLVQHDHLPDYSVRLEGDKVTFVNREVASQAQATVAGGYPRLDPETYHEARIVAPGYDIYALESDWRVFWDDSGRPELKSPDKAFIAFCRKRSERRPIG